jgi:hypothetical protein
VLIDAGARVYVSGTYKNAVEAAAQGRQYNLVTNLRKKGYLEERVHYSRSNVFDPQRMRMKDFL